MSPPRSTSTASPSAQPSRDSHELARLYALHAWRDAQDALVGLYHSKYRGSGLDFAELRDYQPGDDERAVHWPLSLRKGKLLSKLFAEERSTDLLLLFDAKPSLSLYATTWQCALRSAALLAACALSCQDAVGALVLTQNASIDSPPARGHRQLLRLLRDMTNTENGDDAGGPLSLGEAMDQLLARRKPRTRVVVISDLIGDTSYATPLRALAQRHDVLICQITEQTPVLPPAGTSVNLRDAKTVKAQAVPAGDRLWRECAVAAHLALLADSATVAKAAGADYLLLPPPEDPLPALCQHFATKSQRRG